MAKALRILKVTVAVVVIIPFAVVTLPLWSGFLAALVLIWAVSTIFGMGESA